MASIMFSSQLSSNSENSSDSQDDLTTNTEGYAGLFVSAIILIIVTIVALVQILKFYRSKIYPRAERTLCVLFFLPVLIGWTSWVHVATKEKDPVIEKLVNIYKAIALFSFMHYINSMLGWTVADGQSFYSDESLVAILIKRQKADCYLKCLPSAPLQTPSQCKRFVKITNFGVLQMSLVIVLLEVVAFFLLLWDYDLFKYEKSGIFYNIVLFSGICIKFSSSGIALNYILNFSLFCAKIPEFKDLAIMSKFVILKLAMFLTEIQVLIIYWCAWAYVTYYHGDEEIAQVTLYTNRLLLCSEMIIVGILQFTIFPLSDFHFHPVLKEKLIRHDIKHSHDNDHKELTNFS